MRPYIGRRTISLGDAATILAGYAPAEPRELPWENYPEIGEWRGALLDAIVDHGYSGPEIEASSWGNDQDRQQMLSHADIRSWCAARGHTWPIPDLRPAIPTNPEALLEIARLRAQVTSLKTELAEAKQGLFAVDDERWPEELDIAMMAWHAAKSGIKDTGERPGVFIGKWLKKHYPRLSDAAVVRIRTVVNWDKSPGPK